MSDPVQCMYDLNSHAIEINKILIPDEKNSRHKNIFEFKGGLQNGNCTLKMLLSNVMQTSSFLTCKSTVSRSFLEFVNYVVLM